MRQLKCGFFLWDGFQNVLLPVQIQRDLAMRKHGKANDGSSGRKRLLSRPSGEHHLTWVCTGKGGDALGGATRSILPPSAVQLSIVQSPLGPRSFRSSAGSQQTTSGAREKFSYQLKPPGSDTEKRLTFLCTAINHRIVQKLQGQVPCDCREDTDDIFSAVFFLPAAKYRCPLQHVLSLSQGAGKRSGGPWALLGCLCKGLNVMTQVLSSGSAADQDYTSEASSPGWDSCSCALLPWLTQEGKPPALKEKWHDAAPASGHRRMQEEYRVTFTDPIATRADWEEELPPAKHNVNSELKVVGETTG